MRDLLGTVIHGTLRTEDLIPVFISELTFRIEHGMPERPYSPTNVRYVGILHAKMGEIERASEEPGYYESERSMWDLEWLFDELDNVAPVGVRFGAHEGDGTDFGFWTVEGDA